MGDINYTAVQYRNKENFTEIDYLNICINININKYGYKYIVNLVLIDVNNCECNWPRAMSSWLASRRYLFIFAEQNTTEHNSSTPTYVHLRDFWEIVISVLPDLEVLQQTARKSLLSRVWQICLLLKSVKNSGIKYSLKFVSQSSAATDLRWAGKLSAVYYLLNATIK